MTDRTSGSDGVTIELTVSDSEFKTIFELVNEQLSINAQQWVNTKQVISAVLFPQSGVLLFRGAYMWCDEFLVSADADRLAELAWEGITTKLWLKSQTGTIVVKIILTAK